jgi:Rrf2 family protein
MLFTRETDYAIRFFRTLIDGQQHSVSEITERELIPQQFAYKILRKLSGAGLVEVTRGAKGGCTLKADLNEVSLMDLISVVETKKSFVACLDPDFVCPYREKNNGCRVHSNLDVIEHKLSEQLDGISIREMLEDEFTF